MSDYKRLTVRHPNSDYIAITETKQLQETRESKIVLNRLAELEDKIEDGTLAELGYHIRKSYRNHDDQRYKIILIDEVEIDKIGYDGLTKAKAEALLKELQEKQE